MTEIETKIRERFHIVDGKLALLNTYKGKNPLTEIGTDDGKGYRRVLIEGTYKQCHRILWFLSTGHWPEALDHINGNRSDNRLENLRESNKVHNGRSYNRPSLNAASVYRGVSRNGTNWRTRVGDKHVGTFKSEIEAAHAFDKNALTEGYSKEALNFPLDEDKTMKGRGKQ